MTPHNPSTAMPTLGYFPVGWEICMILKGEKDVRRSGESICFIIMMVASLMTRCSPCLCLIVLSVMRTTVREVISSLAANFWVRIHPLSKSCRIGWQQVMIVIFKFFGIIPVISRGVTITGGQRHRNLKVGFSIMSLEVVDPQHFS